MTGTLTDHRTADTRPTSEVALWAVATDKRMSGHGMAPHKSYVAYPVDEIGTQSDLLYWMERRNDYKRVRLNCKLPRLHDGDHLAIYDAPEFLR